jgi:corrinoid protein of di/trimethylamine methyltransferase
MSDILQQVRENLIEGLDQEVASLTQNAIDTGVAPREILNQGLLAGMAVVGERFRAYEIFLPDVLLAARAMYSGLDKLKPFLEGDSHSSRGKIVIGTVQGDLHDIGKNLVAIMLRGAGFEVIDLGHDVSAQSFVEAVREHRPIILGLSALLTTTMPMMAQVIAEVRKAGYHELKVMIGGAPVSEEFAREIAADAYGYDAMRSVEIANDFLAQLQNSEGGTP